MSRRRSLKLYWQEVRKVAKTLNSTPYKIHTGKLSKNLSRSGAIKYLEKKNLKGGKRYYDVVVKVKTSKGTKFQIIHGITGKTKKQLAKNISKEINRYLADNHFVIQKYQKKFKGKNFKKIKKLEVSFIKHEI